MIFILVILFIAVLGYLGWNISSRLSDYCDRHYENSDYARKYFGSQVLMIGLGCTLVGLLGFVFSKKFFCLLLLFIGLIAISASTFLKQKVWEAEGNLDYITGKNNLIHAIVSPNPLTRLVLSWLVLLFLFLLL